jgi:hypothetical protein
MKSNSQIKTRHLTPFLGAKVDGISAKQAHPLDPSAADQRSIDVVAKSSATPERAPRFKRKLAFTAEETRHHYAIEALEKPGSFRPQPYLYTCVRCRWIFRVNDSRGSIIALDGLGRRLSEPENAKRIVTFHRGPCPAFPVYEYLVAEVDRESLLPRYLSRIVEVLRGLADVGRHRNRKRRQETTTA